MQRPTTKADIFEHFHGDAFRDTNNGDWANTTRHTLQQEITGADMNEACRLLGNALWLACRTPVQHRLRRFVAGELCAEAYDDAPTDEAKTVLHVMARRGKAPNDGPVRDEPTVPTRLTLLHSRAGLPPLLKADSIHADALDMAEAAEQLLLEETDADQQRILYAQLFRLHVGRAATHAVWQNNANSMEAIQWQRFAFEHLFTFVMDVLGKVEQTALAA